MNKPYLRWIVYAVLLAGLIAFPRVASRYWTDVAVFFGIYVILGLSLNLILGEVGLFNMGHAAFFAIGAYTTAILSTQYGVPLAWLFPLSGIVAGLFAYVVTRPIIHLRGDYLLIVTIGLNEIIRIALINNPWGLTGGPNGLLVLDRFTLFGWSARTPADFYYLTWGFIVLIVIALVRLQNSRIGRAWNYVREDEVAAAAMGIDVRWAKSLAFTLGAGLAGAAGTLYAAKIRIISPDSFTFSESVILFTIVVLGGLGSIPGVIVAAGALMVLPEIFRDFMEYRMLVFGAAMIVMMIFRPQGLWPSRRWVRELETETTPGSAGSPPKPGAAAPAARSDA
ncbi:MAG: branched-chain amino acid ABC transporter permease [Firmicutes bacterium ZCTH02-B6]|nr:MAG: branched-chain amino acid ABC transporter permease [Firmicutes bacterium ZCTH02-B6]